MLQNLQEQKPPRWPKELLFEHHDETSLELTRTNLGLLPNPDTQDQRVMDQCIVCSAKNTCALQKYVCSATLTKSCVLVGVLCNILKIMLVLVLCKHACARALPKYVCSCSATFTNSCSATFTKIRVLVLCKNTCALQHSQNHALPKYECYSPATFTKLQSAEFDGKYVCSCSATFTKSCSATFTKIRVFCSAKIRVLCNIHKIMLCPNTCVTLQQHSQNYSLHNSMENFKKKMILVLKQNLSDPASARTMTHVHLFVAWQQ